LLLASLALPTGADAQPQAPPPEPAPPAATPIAESRSGEVPWAELTYSAHKFILGATTVIRVERLPAETVTEVLRTPPTDRQVSVPTGGAAVVLVTTDLPFGRDETVKLFFDPTTGAALGGEKTMLGRSAYHKFLRYTDGGLYTWRSAPANDGETALSPEGWTRHKQYLVEPSARPAQGTAVIDSYALLYLVAAARLDRRGSGLRMVMLADDRYAEMTFVAGGLTYSRVNFDEIWPGGSRHREGDVMVRTVRATARALGASESSGDVELGFLGMRGALTIYLEAGTALPVALSGRVQHIGEVTVRLDKVVLKGTPAKEPIS
jgi:hypothetical protein